MSAAYTPEELAERWKVSGKCIREMCVRGNLPYFKIGKLYRIPAAAVDERERVQAWNIGSNSTEEPGQSSGAKEAGQSDAAQGRPTVKRQSGHLKILRGPENRAIVTR